MAWLDRIETNIKAVWYQWSTKLLAALIVFPDAYNMLSSLGWFQAIQGPAVRIMQGVATAGFLAKFYRQRTKEKTENV